MEHIDFDQLVTFERIVREGSFSAAAWALDIPQPTISARIKTLEQTLGGSLFHRTGRRVTLTDLGQTFLPYVRRTIAVLSEGIEMARQAEQGQQGRMTYGGLYSLAGALVGPAVAQFHSTYPDVELTLMASNHQTVIDWLRDRIVELGLVVWPCTESVMTPMQPLLRLREAVIPVVGAEHPLAQRGSIDWTELLAAAHPFLRVKLWNNRLPSAVVKFAAQAESSITVPMESARFMVRAGIGLGFFTRVYIMDDLTSGALVELTINDVKPLYRETALIHLPHATALSAVAENFMKSIRMQALRLGIEILDTQLNAEEMKLGIADDLAEQNALHTD